MRRNRGTSLIFVLGILALLSLFAISFATVTRVERTASANYVDEVRAKLAARSGLAAGIAAAHEGFRNPAPGVTGPNIPGGYLDSMRTILSQSGSTITVGCATGIAPGDTLTLFGGANGASQDVTVATGYTPGTNPVTLTSAAATGRKFALPRGGNWFYHGHSLNPVATGNGIPLAVALTTGTGTNVGHGTPSLRIATGPTLTPIVRMASGSTGGTYFADPAPSGSPYISGGDIYGTKVLDSSGMLDANMTQAALSAILPQFGTDVVKEVTDISDALAGIVPNINSLMPLKDSSGVAHGNPFGTGSNVTAFFNYRDRLSGRRFKSKEQLKGAFYAMAAADVAKAEAWFTVFRDYFTCFGDLDGNAVAGDEPQGAWNPPGGIPRTAGGPNAPADKAQMFQTAKKIDTAGASRTQVNLNTAPFPVLVAVLSTVRSRGLPQTIEDGSTPLAPITINPNLVPMAPYPNAGNGTVTALTHADAVTLANALMSGRPYRSWNEVYKSLNALRPGVSDAVLAAALVATCPVDLPLSMNPDRSLYYWDAVNPDDPNGGFKVAAEKAGSHACADFSFTSGYFEVESVGRIYANPTAPFVVAESTKRCVVNVGGVLWVRGQRDLSTGVAAGVIGAPAVAPGDSFVGGWVQPAPANTGINVAGSLASAGASQNPFTKNIADGFVVQRSQWLGTNSNVIVARANTSPSPDDKGTAEMWVKQPFDVAKGTNEALFMNIRNYNSGLRHSQPGFTDDPDAANTITQIGVATRLERFGNQLYFCRFFWGYPDGASPAKIGEDQDVGGAATAANPTTKYINNMHGYITSPALNWKAGTWHHVYISWDVMQLKMFVDGQDMGTASLPADYKGGVVWENTVQGFFPDSGSGGLDNNNQFKDIPRDTAGEAQVNAAIAAAQAHIPIDQAVIDNPSSSAGAKATAQAHKTQDQETIQEGNDWKNGGSGAGNFATDVQGMTFTAQLGLRRMKLRTHLPIPGANDVSGTAGITESYFLGYKTPDPYNNEAPPEIVTLNFKFGNVGSSFYQRYCNGTFDALRWAQTPSLGAPSPTPHRYNVDPSDNGSVPVTVTLPAGWIAVANGFHVIVANGVFPPAAVTVDLFGGGQTIAVPSGPTVTVTKTFPGGESSCSVPSHTNSCIAGSNEVPWVLSGAWIAYEKPTTFLEAPEVD